MASFVIEGGRRMHGELIPQGAKNEALQILCATLLTPETVEVYNLPDILDVNNLIKLLRDLGVETTKIGEGSYRLRPRTSIWTIFIPRSSSNRVRRCAGR